MAGVCFDVFRDPERCRSVIAELEQAHDVGLEDKDVDIVKGTGSVDIVCKHQDSRAMSERE